MSHPINGVQHCIDHLTACIVKLRPDGVIFMINAAALDMVGVPKQELLGRPLWETRLWVNTGREPNELQQAVSAAAEGRSSHFEFPYQAPEECYVIVELLINPVLDEEGKLLYIVAEGRDISEQRRAEAALRESEERFRSIFESAPLGIFQATIDGRFILVNNTFARAFGYRTPDEMMKAIPDHFAEKILVNSKRWEDALQMVIATEGFCRFENEHRRKDGSVFIANVYIRAVREGHRVALLEGYEEDITSRVQAERRLAEEKRLSETIINAFPGLFYMINRRGQMIWWNDYRDLHFEYEVDEQGYTEVLKYVLEADRGLVAEAMERAFSGEQTYVEARLPHKDGEIRDYYATGAQVMIGGEPRIVGVAVDVTERKRAEEHKRAFYRETILSVTQGKLDLVSREEIEHLLDTAEYSTRIEHPHHVTMARTELETYYEHKGLCCDSLKMFLSGVGEAMTNAIKHAGEGQVHAGANAEQVWAAVMDQGPGIAALTLPGATLRKGFSTKSSLGMGYSIMLDASDCISLATDLEGTSVVLIKDIVQPEPEISLDDLRDTWDEVPVGRI